MSIQVREAEASYNMGAIMELLLQEVVVESILCARHRKAVIVGAEVSIALATSHINRLTSSNIGSRKTTSNNYSSTKNSRGAV